MTAKPARPKNTNLLDDYFGTIDGAYEIIRRHQPPDDDNDPAPDQVVPVIVAGLEAERALLVHCLGNAYEIPNDDAFLKVLKAAAWVVLEHYERAVRNGEWVPA